ncbi:DUF6980 family protein [Microcoleus vaginatus]|jgi:hypothetical protein|uniref:DUF6980 family protein n=1 Tax=Microcoleus vaginatus TaxID=119532 RepID=UPI004040981E
MNHCCEEMKRHISEGEVAICYIPRLREYGILILDGGSAKQSIKYCPWCGKELPNSLSEQWFDELEKIGIEPGDSRIPKEFLSDEWWTLKKE